VAALAQNGNGLRADQAGAADDDDLHGFPPLSTNWKCSGSQVSALGYDVLTPGHSTTSSRCRAVCLRHSSSFPALRKDGLKQLKGAAATFVDALVGDA
jgi:hypothetical protein